MTRQQVIERQAAQAAQEKLMEQATKLRVLSQRCSEEEKSALEKQIRALMEKHHNLDRAATYNVR